MPAPWRHGQPALRRPEVNADGGPAAGAGRDFQPSAALLRYDAHEGLSRVASHPVMQLVDHAMAQIAEDAAALLTGPDAHLVARCASAPCDRFMVRTHARRQWCSRRCGARQRANRAYARKQVSATVPG